MSIKIGNNSVSSVHLGNNEIRQVYSGSDLVWSNKTYIVNYPDYGFTEARSALARGQVIENLDAYRRGLSSELFNPPDDPIMGWQGKEAYLNTVDGYGWRFANNLLQPGKTYHYRWTVSGILRQLTARETARVSITREYNPYFAEDFYLPYTDTTVRGQDTQTFEGSFIPDEGYDTVYFNHEWKPGASTARQSMLGSFAIGFQVWTLG